MSEVIDVQFLINEYHAVEQNGEYDNPSKGNYVCVGYLPKIWAQIWINKHDKCNSKEKDITESGKIFQ